jgi:hypothetical protein
VCGCPSLGVRVSESGCAGVRVRVCGCPSPGVRVSESGCAGVRVRCVGVRVWVCRCPSPGVRVSESGCVGVRVSTHRHCAAAKVTSGNSLAVRDILSHTPPKRKLGAFQSSALIGSCFKLMGSPVLRMFRTCDQ